MKTGFLCGVCSLVLFTVFLPMRGSAESARTSAITEWGDCGGETRTWWDDICLRWREAMGARSWAPWCRNDRLVTIDRYVDSDVSAWGIDSENLDGGDAAMLCTHGGYDEAGWFSLMHHKVNGTCALHPEQMILGAANSKGQLRFFQLSSPNSLNWSNRALWFAAASGGVHVITGFHGTIYIGSSSVDEYGFQADKGFVKGVALAWMDEMYHEEHWYNDYKNSCPVALGFGNTALTAIKALDERYNSHWIDRDPEWVATSYYRSCEPEGGTPLPH